MRSRANVRKNRAQEQAKRAAAGLVSERYTAVSAIDFQMTYYHRAPDPVLMERTIHVSPSNFAHFQFACGQKGCSGGGYDLAPVIDEMARTGKRQVTGRLFCHGSDGPIGHGSIAYRVMITYNRRTA